MKMTERLMEMTADAREQASGLATRAAEAARARAERAAERVEAASGPIETMADAGHKLNRLTHTYLDQIVTQQAVMLKGALHDGTRRLRLLSKAESLQKAYADQVAYFDVTRDRVVRDARSSLEIVTIAGRNLAELAAETYGALRKAPRKAARPGAKQHARKPVAAARTRTRKAA